MAQMITGFIFDHLGSILVGLGSFATLIFAFMKGKSDAKKDDIIATQKEIIDAQQDRSTIEDRFRTATDDERDGMRSPWQRD